FVSPGGTLTLLQGGYGDFDSNAGLIIISSGGTERTNERVSSGGTTHVLSGGYTSDTVVSSGGTTIVDSGGRAFNERLSAGGQLILAVGAVENAGSVFS